MYFPLFSEFYWVDVKNPKYEKISKNRTAYTKLTYLMFGTANNTDIWYLLLYQKSRAWVVCRRRYGHFILQWYNRLWDIQNTEHTHRIFNEAAYFGRSGKINRTSVKLKKKINLKQGSHRTAFIFSFLSLYP